jgi:hypothetical protein
MLGYIWGTKMYTNAVSLFTQLKNSKKQDVFLVVSAGMLSKPLEDKTLNVVAPAQRRG